MKLWSAYLISLGLANLPVEEIRSYFNENIANYFCFIDKLIKFHIVNLIGYTLIMLIVNFNSDHQIIPVISTIVVYVSYLIFIKTWRFTLYELFNKWCLDEDLNEFIQPKLDYKSKQGLYHPSLPIRQLIPKPEESSKQFKQQRTTWCLVIAVLVGLSYSQIRFFQCYFLNPIDDSFVPMLVNFAALNVVRHFFAKFVAYRTDQEDYFTQREHHTNLFVKLLMIDLFVFNSLPLLTIVFGTDPHWAIDVLSTQLLVKFTIDLFTNLVFPVFYYFYKRFVQIISFNKYAESDFVLGESNKTKFNNLLDEWIYVLVQIIYNLLYTSVYPKIIVITHLNILIRNLNNFLAICLLYKRPLLQRDDCYAILIESVLDPILLFCSIINFLNLDLYAYTDQFNLTITVHQFSMLIIGLIFLLTMFTSLLPSQSIHSKNRRQLNQLEKYALFRLLDETNLNQTVDLVAKMK